MRFQAGDFALVRGDTGVGKTTLLKAIGGLQTHEFAVTVDNVKTFVSDSWKPSVAFVSQSPFLFGRNLTEMITGKESSQGVDADLYAESLRISCLDIWSEGHLRNLTNENISGGERKQIALARAVYSKPQILLLDEVTAGMDQKLAKQVIGNLRRCPHFKLIILASHELLGVDDFDQVININ